MAFYMQCQSLGVARPQDVRQDVCVARPQDVSAHDAMRKHREYVQSGLRYVVDIDLSKFFDRVNHDRLLARLATRVKDKRVLKLILMNVNYNTRLTTIKIPGIKN